MPREMRPWFSRTAAPAICRTIRSFWTQTRPPVFTRKASTFCSATVRSSRSTAVSIRSSTRRCVHATAARRSPATGNASERWRRGERDDILIPSSPRWRSDVPSQGDFHIMQPRLRCWRLLLALVALLSAYGLAGAGDWPRFRGPNGAGIAADKDVPVKWTEENILWKTPIPGMGHSSPIVCKGRVFLQSASENGGERWLLCLDAGKGEILWKACSPGGPAKKHPLNSFASSTPTSDGERVYAAFWDGRAIHLGAYDFKDGRPVWEKDLGSYTSQHGFGHSPVVIDGKVILANDQDGASHLLAFDARSG